MGIAEVQKQIVDQETKLKSQQNTYESVRTDRNLKSKNLIESQDKVALMQQKFKILSHSIDQLKQEIISKDQKLVKENFAHHRVENEIQTLRNDLTRIKKQIQSSEQIINNQISEIRKLSKIIADADAERLRQRKEFDAVIAERDMLGTQLIRRNNEVKALYEKIKIARSTLTKGEWTFEERMEEHTYLVDMIEESRKELRENQDAVAPLDDLRRLIIRLEKELLQERNKVKALSEELERPMYVHRWRRLAGSDPKRFAMIQKIQALRKRFVAKDAMILEKEKLYVELKNVLARQPGPEVAEQLALYQKNLKQKKVQMKKVKTELQLYKEQVEQHKQTIETIYQKMDKLKKDYFRKMKKEFFASSRPQTLPQDV